jgi:integrase
MACPPAEDSPGLAAAALQLAAGEVPELRDEFRPTLSGNQNGGGQLVVPTRSLNARFVATVRPTPGKRVEYNDAEVRGLALRVTPAGEKSWTIRYRLLTGKTQQQKRLTLGTTDALTLAQARERARDELYAVSKGADPAAEKQDARKAETIGDLADLYIEKWAKPRKRSWKADDNLLRHKVLPTWRHRAITDITRQDVRLLVEGVAEGGAPIVANRVAALLSKVFAFALDRDLVTASPAVRIPRPGTEQQRDRVLTEDELRTLWKEFGALEAEMGAFYKLRLLTAQRGGEVAGMRWVDVDLKGGWWTIPAGSSKNKLAHRVPLAPTALAIVKSLQVTKPADAGDDWKAPVYVLAGARGKRQQAEAAATFTVDDFRGHDLRRTAASFMASAGHSRLVIAKILNHVERSVTAVYDRHSYDPEKAAALTWWDKELRRIVRKRQLRVVR